MPKSQFISPEEIRKSGTLSFQDIDLNKYNKTIEEEKANFSNDDFMRIYRDMAYIREFESMLYLIKTTSEYNGVAYNNPGPAHLSMGQEASAVGQAYHLGIDDFIFGSHRSHGEIIAKGLSAIEKLDDAQLYDIMKNFLGGKILKIVEKDQKSTKELAIDFLLYGALAEIFARDTGFHEGLGGSMHCFFLPFGIYPNNAIVGGSATVAAGAALFKKVNNKNGICISNIGDGAMGRGPVWEAMNFAAMDQYTKLWEEAYKGGLPVIFNFFNNSYGMGGQTYGETMAYGILARVGAGVTPTQMYSERVDGYNPLAVIDAMRRKIDIIKENKGPVLLDTVTYRIAGHSPSDSSSYRTQEEIQAWEEQDVLKAYSAKLIDAKVADNDAFESIKETIKERITKICAMAADETISPRMDLFKTPDAIEKIMFSNEKIEKMEDRPVDVNMPMEENPRVQAIAKKERWGFDANGKPVSKNKVYQL
ncbi:MAG: thiamine pyrophosphate-dependent dehydrogenase E1 component subunit alpha, partial [Ruminococcaceae bacterium]|nr:thiamine pyrophosphate-dependent dehydrogenase E1 component subunit alpha [Oscillospiraceae bacterium]